MSDASEIEVGVQFVSRRGGNIAVISYLSADGSVGYRLKWTRRILHATAKNFRRNYISIAEYEQRAGFNPGINDHHLENTSE